MRKTSNNSVQAPQSGKTQPAWLMLFLTGCLLSPVAQALEFQCEKPGDLRYIKVEIPGREKLCEVRVSYEYNNQDKAVWHAQSDTTFCTRKAVELKQKYEREWEYKCRSWPNREGISKLSPSQRVILDKRMKMLINRGQSSEPAFSLNSVKAIASSYDAGTSGLLAVQFFLSNGADYTEILADNGTGDASVLRGSLWNLSTHLEGAADIDSALIDNISSTGTLSVQTTAAGAQSNITCIGSQAINVSPDGEVIVKTPHRSVCHQTLAAQ